MWAAKYMSSLKATYIWNVVPSPRHCYLVLALWNMSKAFVCTGCQRSAKKMTTVHGFWFDQTQEINTIFIITFIRTQETKCSLFCFVWGQAELITRFPSCFGISHFIHLNVASYFLGFGFGIFFSSAGSSDSHSNPLLIHPPTTQNTNWPLSLGLLAKHASTLKKSDLYC